LRESAPELFLPSATSAPFDDDRALDALCTIWVKAVYWRPGDS